MRLGALGLFRRVSIDQLPHASEPRRDIFVRVEEADATVIGVGGGIEGAFAVRSDVTGDAVERFEFAPRGFFEIGRRNLWGKNRSVNLFTRVSLRSRDIVLSSPIILYDHPEIAPESEGELCDSTEIDEILLLRVLTMTDDASWDGLLQRAFTEGPLVPWPLRTQRFSRNVGRLV